MSSFFFEGRRPPMESLSLRERLVFHAVVAYFTQRPNDLMTLSRIVKRHDSVSLRFINVCVTVLSHRHGLRTREGVLIWKSYKASLRVYQQKLFDPFCRSKFVYVNCRDMTFTYQAERNHTCAGADEFVSSLSQLIYFRWLISQNILAFIEENVDALHCMAHSGFDARAEHEDHVTDGSDPVLETKGHSLGDPDGHDRGRVGGLAEEEDVLDRKYL